MIKVTLKDVLLDQMMSFGIICSCIFALLSIRSTVFSLGAVFGFEPHESLLIVLGPLLSILVYRVAEAGVLWYGAPSAELRADHR